MHISKEIYDQMVEIAKNEKPNEACGYLFKNNTILKKLHPKSFSVAHFSDVDPKEIAKLLSEYGNPSATFHSHPCEAIPSGTDRMYMITHNLCYGVLPWIIMSDTYKIRAWRYIDSDTILEEEIIID